MLPVMPQWKAWPTRPRLCTLLQPLAGRRSQNGRDVVDSECENWLSGEAKPAHLRYEDGNWRLARPRRILQVAREATSADAYAWRTQARRSSWGDRLAVRRVAPSLQIVNEATSLAAIRSGGSQPRDDGKLPDKVPVKRIW